MAENRAILKKESISEIPFHSRVFALEFQQTDMLIRSHNGREADLITPTGARVSRFYFCGALTEIHRSGKGGYVRVADPTGVMVLNFRTYDSTIPEMLDSLATPSFVSLTGTVETDPRPDVAGFRLMLESISVSDRASRDRWILRTANITLGRLESLYSALNGEQCTDEIRRAIARYRTSPRQIQVLVGMVEKAVHQVQTISQDQAAESEEQEVDDTRIAEMVMDMIRSHSGPRGISVQELTGIAAKSGIGEPAMMDIIRTLISDDELYQPSSGFVKIL